MATRPFVLNFSATPFLSSYPHAHYQFVTRSVVSVFASVYWIVIIGADKIALTVGQLKRFVCYLCLVFFCPHS